MFDFGNIEKVVYFQSTYLSKYKVGSGPIGPGQKWRATVDKCHVYYYYYYLTLKNNLCNQSMILYYITNITMYQTDHLIFYVGRYTYIMVCSTEYKYD